MRISDWSSDVCSSDLDERHFDRFDRAFGAWFKGVPDLQAALDAAVPADWLRRAFEREFSAEERARIEALGGLDKLLEELRKRLNEQHARHQGGNHWIGPGDRTSTRLHSRH